MPDEFLQKLGGCLSKAKRQGFVLDDQIDPRWIDQYRSHPVSFPTVQEDPSEVDQTCLVASASKTHCRLHLQEDLRSLFTNSSGYGPHETAHTSPRVVRHKRSLPRVCRQLPVWLPCSVDHSPDQHYRPPTPPLKREHPERRPRSTHRSAQQEVLPVGAFRYCYLAAPDSVSASTPRPRHASVQNRPKLRTTGCVARTCGAGPPSVHHSQARPTHAHSFSAGQNLTD